MDCGTKLPDGAKFCFSCGVKVEINTQNRKQDINLPERVFEPKAKVKAPFLIGGKEIYFEKSIYENAKYRSVYIGNGYKLKQKLKEYCLSEVKSFDDIISKEIPECLDYISQSVELAINELIKNNIFEYEADSFVKKFNIDEGFLCDIEVILKKNDELATYVDEVNYKRNVQRNSRSYWQGGGFGLRGAIKGSIMAGMMNAGTGIVRSIGDSFVDAQDTRKLQDLKRKFYNENNYQEVIIDAVFKANDRIGYGVCKILNDNGLLASVVPIIEEDIVSVKLDNLEKSIRNHSISIEQAKKCVIDWMSENPFSIQYCEFLYRVIGINNNETEMLCEFLGCAEEMAAQKIFYIEKCLEKLEKMPDEQVSVMELSDIKRLAKDCELSKVDLNRIGQIEYRLIDSNNDAENIVGMQQDEFLLEAKIRGLIRDKKINDVWNIFLQGKGGGYIEWMMISYYENLVDYDLNRSNFDAIEEKMHTVYCLMESGNVFASALVNDIKRKVYTRNKNTKKIISTDEKLEQLSNGGQTSACALVGFLYYRGDEYFKKNYEKAFTLLKYAAERNHPMAMAWLGTCYLNGLGTGKDFNKARNWLELAAYYGHEHAMDELKKM